MYRSRSTDLLLTTIIEDEATRHEVGRVTLDSNLVPLGERMRAITALVDGLNR